jgi:hypothetical protein
VVSASGQTRQADERIGQEKLLPATVVMNGKVVT